MKLRIRGNSIRLRLVQSEVAALREGRAVEERVALEPAALVYSIERARGPRVTARFEVEGAVARLVIEVPDAILSDFCDTDRVGFDTQDGALKILVEKDWQCLAPRDEDDPNDAYPHPRQKTQSA